MSITLTTKIPEILSIRGEEMLLISKLGIFRNIILEEKSVLIIIFDNCDLRIDISIEELYSLVDENKNKVFVS